LKYPKRITTLITKWKWLDSLFISLKKGKYCGNFMTIFKGQLATKFATFWWKKLSDHVTHFISSTVHR
jgi:hypothetical protein